jgi:hypothetical protein
LHLTLYGAGLLFYIAEHAILSDPKYWKHLPADYRSLYELSQIDDDKLLDYIRKDKVHHDLKRGKAVKLKLDSRDDASADVSSGKRAAKNPLPLPTVSPALAVLRGITRYFCSDQIWKAHDSQNLRRPSELPSKEDIDAALRWVEMQRSRKRGAR